MLNANLDETQKILMQSLLMHLNGLETEAGIRYTIIKDRYFKVCRITPEIEAMVEAGLPILPVSMLTFSRNRIYEIQTQYVNDNQFDVLTKFCNQWREYNHIK